MIDVADEGTRLRHANPVIPVEGSGYRVGALGQRVGIAPLLLAERMYFLDLPDGAALDHLNGGLVLAGGINLDAHLRGPIPLAPHGRNHGDLCDAPRPRLF